MLEALQGTYLYRVLLGVAFFVVLGIHDWVRHPEDPRRAKEYLFLLFAAVAAVVYGIAHDHLTATISPDYFIYGKELVFDPPRFRVAVTILALKASYGVGLLAGALILIANNPSPRKASLPYRQLLWLALVPLAGAAVFAIIGGGLYAIDVFGLRPFVAREILVDPRNVSRFLVVWGIHTGSYAGAAIGTVAALVIVRLRRRECGPPVPGPSRRTGEHPEEPGARS